ncbi:alpha-1B adrenergic receptor-like [Stylophora pistillata]|uniref:alpha-1B adrenergic receptor-like n=1 Tax=Stylophora pistillata TaxID=50429 RepID=UPI000C0561A1|nr:alpha-1B adrenergic receptor-like [Stylophora pistillata]
MVNETRTNTPDTSKTFSIVNCALNAPLMFMAIIGNALVLIATSRTPSLRSPSIILLCSMTFSDLLVGLVAQPLYIASEMTKEGSLSRIMETVAFSACGVSLSSITVISVDRLMALHYHMRYPYVMTAKRAICISATLWLICVVLSLSTYWKQNIYHSTIVATILVCLLVCTICYMKIYRIVRRHQLQITIQAQQVAKETSKNANGHELNIVRSTKNAKNTFIYYAIMILCYMPLFISMSVSAISRQYWRNELSLAETVAFMNSSINPFLYCWRIRELRMAVAKTTKHILRQKTE